LGSSAAGPSRVGMWHDPRTSQAALAVIRDAMVTASPAGAAMFRRNACHVHPAERSSRPAGFSEPQPQ
jgi:hypothetical protein